MVSLLAAFGVSFAVTMAIVRWPGSRDLLAGPALSATPQNFHVHATRRLGGLGIVAGVLAGLLSGWSGRPASEETPLLLLLCAVPAFVAGIAEDITRQVSPLRRLVFTAVSAALASGLLGLQILRTDIPGLDWLVSFSAGAAVLTVFAVVGVANAVNIIDGFNGLASMCVLMMLAGLAFVGWLVGDELVLRLALLGVAAVIGFFVWNFPRGLVFLGDGGAYFLGFYLSELALMLLLRNDSVSPLFPLLLCFYPVFETLFSIYRRRLLSARPVGMPDGLHLHSLIYRRLLRWPGDDRSARELTRRNSMTSPYLWGLCSLSVVPAVLWWDNSAVLAVFMGLFALAYSWLYWRIVRFKAPRWMRARRVRAQRAEPADNWGR